MDLREQEYVVALARIRASKGRGGAVHFPAHPEHFLKPAGGAHGRASLRPVGKRLVPTPAPEHSTSAAPREMLAIQNEFRGELNDDPGQRGRLRLGLHLRAAATLPKGADRVRALLPPGGGDRR